MSSETPQSWTDNTQKIKTAPNLTAEEAMSLAKEDGVFSSEEFEAMKERFKNDKLFVYKNYLKEKLDITDLYRQFFYSKEMLLKSIDDNLITAFIYFEKYQSAPYAKEVLLRAVDKHPDLAFYYFDKYQSAPYAKEVLLRAVGSNPRGAFLDFEKYQSAPYAQEVLLKAAENIGFDGFASYSYYESQPYAEETLKYVRKNKNLLLKDLEKNPDYAFYHFDKYQSEPYAKEILLKAAALTPMRAFRLFNRYESAPYAKEILNAASASKETLLKEIAKNKDKLEIFEYYAYYKSSPHAEEIISKSASIVNNEDVFHKDSPYLKNKDTFFLKIGRVMNDLHNEKPEIRFWIISHFDENKLYRLVQHGRSEIFTSTYNGIINKFIATWKNLYDVAKANNFDWLTTFVEAAASYGRLDELFGLIPDNAKKKELINMIFDEKNIKWDVGSYVAIMEIINNSNSAELVKYIGEKIRANYASGVNRVMWWMIAKNASGKFSDDPFFKSIPDIYKLPDIKWIPSNELFDGKWRNVQQYFFYNDRDGKGSYESFIRNYRGNSEWNITDEWSFVIIVSKAKNGKSITIYANKPENDGSEKEKPNGFDAIRQNMDSLKPPLESIVVVHRWHSYHAQKTIDRIPPTAKMVFLGSCGGFQDIGKILGKSGSAHIIATKWIGTMTVNDPLFKAINEQILSGKDIVWEDVWNKIAPRLKNNKDFWNYVRPDQNLGVLFHKKKMELEAGGK